MSSDEDLKLSDCLRYYERDSQAALVSRCHAWRSLYPTLGPAVQKNEESG